MDQTRRAFIKHAAVAVASLPAMKLMGSAPTGMSDSHFPIAFFTKPLDGYELDFMLEVLAEAGVDGLDLAVRPGGRVEPAEAAEQLLSVVEAAKRYGLKTEMMVSAVGSPSEPGVKDFLKTAARAGIKHYRLGYLKHEATDIAAGLERIRKDMVALTAINEEVGIQGGYQNHSGTNFGAPIWDLWEVLKSIPSNFMSSQFDIRHAVTEGAFSWELAMRLMGKRIGSLAIKDFTWKIAEHHAKVVSVPLGAGIVDFDLFFSILRESGILAPITLHTEYPLLPDNKKNLSLIQQQRIITEIIKKDVDFIRLGLAKFKLI